MHAGTTKHLPGTIQPMLGEEVMSLANPAPSYLGNMSRGWWLGRSFL